MTAEELGKIIARHEMKEQGTKGTDATEGTGRSLKSFAPAVCALAACAAPAVACAGEAPFAFRVRHVDMFVRNETEVA